MREALILVYSVTLIFFAVAYGIILKQFENIETEISISNQKMELLNIELSKVQDNLEFTNIVVDKVTSGAW